ncbi:MAG: hypothetical protein ACYDG2_10265 [Ruminiclostridium sp.]
MKKRYIKFGAVLLSCMLVTTSLLPAGMAFAAGSPDYGTAFIDSIIFYDSNKCGENVAVNNAFDWRGACHTDGIRFIRGLP